eukprot:10038630-Lingulodinium_polyedra.AAC.1
MDPPLIRENVASVTGTPMQRVVPRSALVRDLVTELHTSSPFRLGEPPYDAYDPTVPEGTERALPGTYA